MDDNWRRESYRKSATLFSQKRIAVYAVSAKLILIAPKSRRIRSASTSNVKIRRMTKSNFLADDEVANVCTAADSLKDHYQTVVSITPKMHMIVMHFPRIAEKYRNLGMFSEQDP